MPPNLRDIDGKEITTDRTYKIQFADGTELGQGSRFGEIVAAPDSSGAGAVLQYVRIRGDKAIYGWPQGDVGYLKAYIVNPDGKGQTYYLSLSDGAPGSLRWLTSDTAYGFTMQQLPGNRLALYARDKFKSDRGVRLVDRRGDNPGKFVEDVTTHRVTIDFSLVEIAGPLVGF